MTNEQRIRELAYQIWESEGRPEGQDARHWQMAIKLLDSEQKGDLQPAPDKKTATRKPRSKPVAPANDETQMEKPALLGKPAGAAKSGSRATTAKPAAPRRKPVARTPKISEPGNSKDSSTE